MLEERTLGGLHSALFPCVAKLEGIDDYSAILDLACGTGAWLTRLHDAGYRNLWGADRDFEHFGAQNIARFFIVDFDDKDYACPVNAHGFALITAIEIIEHVANPHQFIASAA